MTKHKKGVVDKPAKAAPKARSTSIKCSVVGCQCAAKYVPRTFTERVPTCCPEHAQPRKDFFEFTSRLCEVETCHRRASFAQPGLKKSLRCGEHKLAGDVNREVGARRCPCGKVASFKMPDEEGARFCAKCKPSEAVTINNMCEECHKYQARAFRPDDPPEITSGSVYTVCATCAKNLGSSVTNRGIKRCIVCDKSAHFGPRGGRPRDATHCGACCDRAIHEDLSHDRCDICCDTRRWRLCDDDGKWYCHECFVKAFGRSLTTRNYKNKERAVEDFLIERFGHDKTLVFDRKVTRILFEPTGKDGDDDKSTSSASSAGAGGGVEEDGGGDGAPCKSSGRKPDVLIDMGEWVVIVEVDERQHRQQIYKGSCENKRIMQIFDDAGRRPIVFIRFNPDSYKNSEGHRIPSPWTNDGRTNGLEHVPVDNRSKWEHRLATLASVIERATSARPEREITLQYLYFDGHVA